MLPTVTGGTETYARGLISGLATTPSEYEFVLFLNEESSDWDAGEGNRFERQVVPLKATSRFRRLLFEQTRLPYEIKRRRIRLLHSLGYVGPAIAPCATVVTIPDANAWSEWHRLGLARFVVARTLTRWSAQRAGAVLTLSGFGRQEVIRWIGVPPGRVKVTYPGSDLRPALVGPPLATSGGGVRRPYFIAFSSPHPHKNLDRLVEAFRIARMERGVRHELEVLGNRPPWAKGSAGNTEGVRFVGYVSESEKEQMFDGAEALIFPSLYEGLGFPLLEAMARGVPVLCSDRASLPEIGGDAPVYFDALSVPAIAEAIVRFTQDPSVKNGMIERGFRQAARFSWKTTAEKTLAVYQRVLRKDARVKMGGEEQQRVIRTSR